MKELIERGHIYIAQAPLYKVTQGKQERYVKDDIALNHYLVDLALQDAELYHDPQKTALAQQELAQLCRHYLQMIQLVKRLSRNAPLPVLEAMFNLPLLKDIELATPEYLTDWVDCLTRSLPSGLHQYQVTLQPASDSNGYVIYIQSTAYGVESVYTLGKNFFSSSEYQALAELGQQLSSLLQPGAFVRRREKRREVTQFKQVIDWLLEEAQKNLHIQRYKGLGEMNPEQLWETTMNMQTRHLLQVCIEDAIAADEIFTILMGDQVEPRRDFIEKNALSVCNLDA
jgi:DNA gyrase subunit B